MRKSRPFVNIGLVSSHRFQWARDADWKLVKIGVKAVALLKNWDCAIAWSSDEFGKACDDTDPYGYLLFNIYVAVRLEDQSEDEFA